MFGVQDSYLYELARLWPSGAPTQSLLLVVVWTHGCLGIHHWLKFKAWYRAVHAIPPEQSPLDIDSSGPQLRHHGVSVHQVILRVSQVNLGQDKSRKLPMLVAPRRSARTPDQDLDL